MDHERADALPPAEYLRELKRLGVGWSCHGW
jgi:hypothetical protein